MGRQVNDEDRPLEEPMDVPDVTNMGDGEIRIHLRDVVDRVNRDGLNAQPPSSEEQVALFLAVNQLFEKWYGEFYLS